MLVTINRFLLVRMFILYIYSFINARHITDVRFVRAV